IANRKHCTAAIVSKAEPSVLIPSGLHLMRLEYCLPHNKRTFSLSPYRVCENRFNPACSGKDLFPHSPTTAIVVMLVRASFYSEKIKKSILNTCHRQELGWVSGKARCSEILEYKNFAGAILRGNIAQTIVAGNEMRPRPL